MSEVSSSSPTDEQRPIEPRKRLIIALALVAVVSLVAWALSGGSGTENSSTQSPSTSAPETISLTAVPASIVTKEELIAATKDLGFPIYWNGEMENTKIELTVLTEGKVFVRYLPTDVVAGTADPYFTVASFYDSGALEKAQSVGAGTGAKLINYTGGAVAASSSESDKNVYFAFAGNPVLYDIYSPDSKVAWEGLDSGTIAILQ